MKRLAAAAGIFAVALFVIAGYFHGWEADSGASIFSTSTDNSGANISQARRSEIYFHSQNDDGEIYTYTAKQIAEYFTDVVFSSELDGYVGRVCKWISPVKYRIYGDRSEEDVKLFEELAEYLNGIEGFPGISEAESAEKSNFDIYYASYSDMPGLFDNYIPGSWGMASFWWNSQTCEIVRGKVAIVCDVTDQTEKNTLALEEITQALGIGQDSYMYPESLYYQKWSQPQKMPYIDRCVLEILYSPLLPCGTPEKEAVEIAYLILEER